MSDEILTERRGRVLVITINRPESRNAVNLAVSQGLADAVDEPGEVLAGAIAFAEKRQPKWTGT